MSGAKREVICEDVFSWLNQTTIENASIIGSLPDISEFPELSLPEWSEWFTATARLLIEKTPSAGVTIFFQSDIKHQDEWVDKGYLVLKAAEQAQTKLLWHKIICRTPPGVATFGRPSYSHLLCFSKSVRLDQAKSTPDVMDAGEKAWARGMGLKVSLSVARFLKETVPGQTVINAFCGHGSMLAAANFEGMNAIGIEKSPKRAKKAMELAISSDAANWIS